MADASQTTIVSDQGRVGLARSRHDVEGSGGASKKQKTSQPRTAGVRPEQLWQSLEACAAGLSKVAQVLLAIPPASATSERVYSAVGRVWNTSHSRLSSTRVRKLLFIYFNRKALLRDGAAVQADDFAAFEEWLDSLE
jgi:hypothetical protein